MIICVTMHIYNSWGHCRNNRQTQSAVADGSVGLGAQKL